MYGNVQIGCHVNSDAILEEKKTWYSFISYPIDIGFSVQHHSALYSRRDPEQGIPRIFDSIMFTFV